MKKTLSVFLALLMLCSAFSATAFAEEKYPSPAEPTNLAFSADGVASWDAVEVPAFVVEEDYDTECTIQYRVSLARWDYDAKDNNWIYTPVGNEIVTEDTSADLSAYMDSGYYIFTVTAVAAYARTKKNDENAKTANFKRISETVELDRDSAVKKVIDIYEEPVDTSVPFETFVKEDDENANFVVKIVRKIKEVILILLRFVGYAGDLTGISDEIRNKK